MARKKIAIVDLGGTIVDETGPCFQKLSQEIIDIICGINIDCNLFENMLQETLIQFNIEISKKGSEQKTSKSIIEEMICKNNLPISVNMFEDVAWHYLGGENTSYLKPLPYATNLLDFLNEEDFKIIALSNTTLPISILKKIFVTHGIYDLFSCFILSSECGYKKPSNEIFNYLEQTQNISPYDYILSIGNSYEADIQPSLIKGYISIYLERSVKTDVYESNLKIFDSLEYLYKNKSIFLI